jgi:aminobenzoyl-glutamate utilization protein B
MQEFKRERRSFQMLKFVSKITLCLALLVLAASPAFNAELTPAMKDALSWIDSNKTTYEEIARYIWENPELSLAEFKSSAKLQEYLAGQGFKIEKGISGMPTAFIATWGSGKPVIGFTAEFDALPGLSQESGVAIQKAIISGAPGHGCGHNLLGTSNATAAIAVTKAMEKHGIKGTIQVFGTPAEENLVGKAFMNRDGVFDGLDILIDMHPDFFNNIAYYSDNAITYIKYRFYGKASHAATPEKGRSALAAAELMNAGANLIRPHLDKEVGIRYVITKGGESLGVIPAYAENLYRLNARRRAQAEDLEKWVMDLAKGAALMTQTKVEAQILTATYELLLSRSLSRVGYDFMKLLGPPPFKEDDHKFGEPFMKSIGKELVQGKFSFAGRIEALPDFSKVFPDVFLAGGSNDLNNISWKIPLVRFFASTWALWTGHHTWQSVAQSASSPAMKGGIQASKWMAASALECLTNPKLIQEAKEELKKVVAKNGGYREPIPADAKLPTFKDLFGIEPDAVPGMKK